MPWRIGRRSSLAHARQEFLISPKERERETLIPSKNEPTSLESKKPEDDETGSGSRRDTDNLSLENEFWNYSFLIELYEDN